MSRPQVSIDRLTPRRVTAEPRESMNCKSCRKRKIKCNRLRPSCEACKVFQCPCIYDAVPKKRGPKTDMLEALLKRVDGLEKRLQDDHRPLSPSSPVKPAEHPPPHGHPHPHSALASSSSPPAFHHPPPGVPFVHAQHPVNSRMPDAMLDAYFARLHGKPFFVLDEMSTRQRHQSGQLPVHLSMAIYALTLRYTTVNPPPGSLDHARHARRMVDIDQPSIENLQTLLLLSQTFYAYGCGKKAYMTLAHAVSVVVALDLYRELPASHPASTPQREMRRRLFWAVYVMDRSLACGSKRPCLIADHSIVVRLPASSSSGSDPGDVFNPVGPNIAYSSDRRKGGGSAAALLVDITRILGVTHRYLAAGGVKGDSHFPWHALSNLSKIRQELDLWATGTHDLFASIEALFGHPESTVLLLSKLIYHLVHCLLYRPFLPIDLAELRGSGQHQSWQIEAMTLCFSHANAIAELVELARHAPRIEWPALVAYCLTVAGTVHIHGVHYHGRDGEVFASSADFLAREMHQLAWLRQFWAGIQHQRDLLQTLSACHADLVRTLAARPARSAPVFHLEDFLERYLDRYPLLDGSHVRLIDDEMNLDPHLYAPPLSNAHPVSFHSWSEIPPELDPPNFLSPHSDLPTLQPQPRSHTQPPTHGQMQLQGQTQTQYATFPFESNPPTTTTSAGITTGPGTSAGTSTPSPPSHSHSHTSSGNGNSPPGKPSTDTEKDPFLSLLEQIAKNEHSQGGPSELDFFLEDSLA